ncbi:MAG: dienelactone hydrolase family protein [Haloferacaceae archaeon]
MSEETVAMHAHYTSEGQDVHGYLSRPVAAGPWPGVVLVHAYMGMGDHYRDLARRLSREGFVVLAPDLYHGEAAEDHAQAARLKAELDVDRAVTEMLDGADYLHSLPYVSAGEGVLGFCMSGGLALLAAARGGLDGAVAYYPSLYPDADVLARIDCPVQLHYGTADEITPASEMTAIREAFDDGAVDYEYHEYEGADHAFLNDTYDRRYHAEAAAEAWERTVEFFRANLRGDGQ